jgi:hypothetical protein
MVAFSGGRISNKAGSAAFKQTYRFIIGGAGDSKLNVKLNKNGQN